MKAELREKLAHQSFEEKIRKVSELIRLSRNVKASSEDTERLDRAKTEIAAGKDSSIGRIREGIPEWEENSEK